MSIDRKEVLRIARLARIALSDAQAESLRSEINGILGWIDQLEAVDVRDVAPLTSIVPMKMKKRADEITDGGYADRIVANAPRAEDHYFVVPKVVE